jgi:integrase
MATIERRGNRQWRAKVRKKGSPTQSRTFNTRADAERWGKEIEVAIDRGVFVSSKESDSTTLADAVARYELEVSSLKKSAKAEKWRLKLWRMSSLAEKPLSRIKGADVAQWRNIRLKAVKSGTARNDLALLSHIFTVAKKEWGMTDLRNPVGDIKKPPPGPSRTERIRQNDQKRLMDAAVGQFGPLADIIEFAIETAMRRSEIFDLCHDRINYSDNVAHISKTKNGVPRDVPLSQKAMAVIKRQPKQGNGKVFSGWTSIDAVTNDFRVVAGSVGLEHLTFHDTRHEATSRLFEKGFGIMEVATITGHKSLVMLERYTHMTAKNLAERLG